MTSLLLKEFSGEASFKDKQEILSWKSQNEDNLKFYEELVNTWTQDQISKSDIKFDGESVYKKIYNISNPDDHVISNSKTKFISWLFRVSAIFIVVFISLYFYNKSEDNILLVNNSSEVICDTLSDGTVFWMNRNSEMVVFSDFGNETRNISVRGEIYFDVFEDKSNPFIVTTNIATIRVIGTEFNVVYKPESDFVEVIVESGRVQFYNDEDIYSGKGFKADLVAGEIAYYSCSSGKMIREKNDNMNYLFWKTGDIIFESTIMTNVIKTLNELYNVNIQSTNSSLQRYRLTATLKGKSIDEIIRDINLKLHQKFNLEVEILFI